jgi:hypothetical protein
MIRSKLFLACALTFAVSLAGTTASAQAPVNQLTYFTFSAPFELPGGQTLPAGTYTFKIIDSPSNRHVIHIMSEDQRQMHATVMAIPAQRQEPSDEPEVRFMEAEANAAPAIKTWWYPGRTIGHEFIYPQDQARRLAARQSESVLTTAGNDSSEAAMRDGELARIGADGQLAAENVENNNEARPADAERADAQRADAERADAERADAERVAANENESAAAERAAVATEQQPTQPQTAQQPGAQDDRMTNERTELPRTASPLPLVGLIGLGSLLGAGILRVRR